MITHRRARAATAAVRQQRHVLPGWLWRRTREGAGISKEFFMSYFGDKVVGYAIRIKATKRYRKPLCLKSDYNLKPPQSYLYL